MTVKGFGGDLFRSDALRATRHDSFGKVSIAVPLGRWVYSALTVLIAIAMIVYACVGRYTRRAAVVGELVPTTGLITLDASSQSLVARVLIREGQSIEQGQPLLEFDNPLDTSKLGNTRDVISVQLEAQRADLERDLITEENLADSRAKALRERISSLDKQGQELDDQLSLQEEQVKAFTERLKKIEPLAGRGYLSQYEFQRQQAEVLSSRGQAKALARQSLDIKQQVAQAKQELAQVPLNLASQQTTIRNHLSDLKQSLAQNEGQRSWIMRAPRAGLVSALLVKPGQAVNVGRPLISILPKNCVLEAQLLVPSGAIGFVRTGQRVALRYEAFPFQKFGQYFGKVAEVSRSALSPADAESLFGQHTEGPQYRVVVDLDRQAVAGYGASLPLMPGMAVNADILLDRRRLIEWVIGPMMGFGQKAMGERTVRQAEGL